MTAAPDPESESCRLFPGEKADAGSLLSELAREIESAERIDMMVSFILESGLSALWPALERFARKPGAQLRLITTCYMGITSAAAVAKLAGLPCAEAKIEYRGSASRLHAKGWIFIREGERSTAFVGSSNLSRSALTTGLEWNIRVSEKEPPALFRQIQRAFEESWANPAFERFDPKRDAAKLKAALRAQAVAVKKKADSAAPVPAPFQELALGLLETERAAGHFRNLVEAATGTGKTMIAAFDFRRFLEARPGARLLYLAHKREILEQAREKFRRVLEKPDFGRVLAGGSRPADLFETPALFAMIPTMAKDCSPQAAGQDGIPEGRPVQAYAPAPETLAQPFCRAFRPDHFDYIVIDEAHHSAADTWDRVISWFEPKILLGLTATPFRMDGQDIRKYFDGMTVASIRLPEAIGWKILAPFHYFVMDDDTDLSKTRTRGGVYERKALEKAYLASLAANSGAPVIAAVRKEAARLEALGQELKAIAFCSGIEHAERLAALLRENGFRARSVTSASSEEERSSLKTALESGELQVAVTVDLYNEGIDIPAVNAVLFLRPTESLTVFLQQLGRGLRRAPGKEFLTVLDFVGAANKSYTGFAPRFRALQAEGAPSLTAGLEVGTLPGLPEGCRFSMAPRAKEWILENLRAWYTLWDQYADEVKEEIQSTHAKPSFAEFLARTGKTALGFYLEGFPTEEEKKRKAELEELPEGDPRRKELEEKPPKRGVRSRQTFARLLRDSGIIAMERPEAAVLADYEKRAARLATLNDRRLLAFLDRFLNSAEFRSGAWRYSRTADGSARPREERIWLSQFFQTFFPDHKNDHTFAEGEAGLEKQIRGLFAVDAIGDEIRDVIRSNLERATGGPAIPFCGNALQLHARYTKQAVYAAIRPFMGSDQQGVRYFPEHQTIVLFITIQKSSEYSETIQYKDALDRADNTLLHWQSQNTTASDSETGMRYASHKAEGITVQVFARHTNRLPSDDGHPFTYLGPAEFISAEGSKPMSVKWRLVFPVSEACRRELERQLIQ